MNFLQFYSRWKWMLVPGAPAALRVCSIICSSCLWRCALCEEEQNKTFFFNNGFLFKKPLFWIKTVVFEYFWILYPLEGLVGPRYQNTLPNCSNLPYATFIPTLGCPVWPADASGRPRGPKWAPNRVFGDVPKWYDRDWSLIASLQRSHNTRRGVPPTLDQVWPLNSS